MSVDISQVLADQNYSIEIVRYAESKNQESALLSSDIVSKSNEIKALMSTASAEINLPATSIKGSLEGPLSEKMTQIHSKNLSLSNTITQSANNLRD